MSKNALAPVLHIVAIAAMVLGVAAIAANDGAWWVQILFFLCIALVDLAVHSVLFGSGKAKADQKVREEEGRQNK